MLKSYNLLGVNISVVDLKRASEAVFQFIEKKKKGYVCIAPVSTVVDCQSDITYCDIINKALMTTPDGMPVVWMGKVKGHKDIQRTYGPDLMQLICEQGQKKGVRHFFYGSNPKNIGLLISTLIKKYPDINIVGHHAPDFLKVGQMESESVIEHINRSKPDVLWVGLGSPKQDYWMSNHRDKLDVPVIVGVGAAFDFISGLKPQAPKWMQKCGLEWFFRLCCEPKRLWKRYLLGNTLFIIYVICDGFRSLLKLTEPKNKTC